MDEFSKELLPCPFCGAAARLEEESDHHGEFYNLGCSDDKCFAHHVCYTWTPEDAPVQDAIAKWNTRSDAAYSLGLAKGRKEGMIESAKIAAGYRITNCKSHHDDAVDATAYNIEEDIRQAARVGDPKAVSGANDSKVINDIKPLGVEINGDHFTAQTADRATGGECCEWIRGAQPELYTICKRRITFGMLPANRECPYCGRKIHVKES